MDDRHKKINNYDLACNLEHLLSVLPMVEEQRNWIKEAIERLKHLDD